MVITPQTQSLYRLGVALTTLVDKEILRKSVETALLRYPYFKTEIKRGFFRPYLDENSRPIVIKEDNGVLLDILNFSKNNRYLFRVSYYKNKFFIDFFHGLCDGTGALNFLKTVVYYYGVNLGKNMDESKFITLSTTPNQSEWEDSFDKYYRKINLIKGTKSMAGGNAYRLKGKQFINPGFGMIEGLLPTTKLLDLARSYNCTVTVFLTALMLLSVAKTQIKGAQKDNLIAFIPINLRKRYESNTMFNFTVFAKCIIPKDTPHTLIDMINAVKVTLQNQLEKEEVQLKLSFTSLMAKFLPLKILPLFIKGFISRIGRSIGTKTKQTFILSNLGMVDFGENDIIKRICFNLNCSKKTPNNVGVVTYKDKTVICFTRRLISTEIEREFFSTLSNMGLDVEIRSNFREDCNAL